MHSLQVIVGGLVLWSTALLARTMFDVRVGGVTLCIAFCLVWFVASGVNMAMGMYGAGYSFIEELPFFLLVFGVPSVAAVLTMSR